MAVENQTPGTPPPQAPETPPVADPPSASPPAPAEPTTSPPEQQEIKFPSQEKFNERMNRHHTSQLKKEFGVDSPDQLKSQLQELEQFKAEQAERERAAMSEQEKLQADLKAAQAEKQALQEERDQIKFESHVNGVCAELGVTNIDYAMYELAKAAESAPEGQQIDAKEHLNALLENQASRAALGLPPLAQEVPTGATSTPDPNVAPPTPEPNTPGGKQKDVLEMDRQEFNAHLAQKGVGLLGG